MAYDLSRVAFLHGDEVRFFLDSEEPEHDGKGLISGRSIAL